jgi:hypothetical protein
MVPADRPLSSVMSDIQWIAQQTAVCLAATGRVKQTQADFAISEAISGVNMRLTAGGIVTDSFAIVC